MMALITRTLLITLGLCLFSSSVTKIDRFGFGFGKRLFAKNDRPTPAPLFLMVSAVWEGSHIRPHNITAIQNFRRKFGGIPLTHFISPAYFLHKSADKKTAEALIRSTLSIRDEVGMVLHPWQSVTKKAGVMFRKSPTFWGNQLDADACKIDCGSEVPLAVYSKTEISQMISAGTKVLAAAGFKNLQSFMAGGWMATPHVLSAAAAFGFKFDYSAVSQHLVRPKLEHYPLYGWIGEVWHDTTPHTQPYSIDTGYGDMIEVGNSAATVDYLATQEIIDLFETYLAKKRANPRESLMFHIAFHQETAFKYLPRLESALQHVFARSSQDSIVIRPLTLPFKDSAEDLSVLPAQASSATAP